MLDIRDDHGWGRKNGLSHNIQHAWVSPVLMGQANYVRKKRYTMISSLYLEISLSQKYTYIEKKNLDQNLN